jgi:hypothetical protein
MDEGRTLPLPAMQQWAWASQAPAQPAAAGHAVFVTIATADRAAQSRILARSVRGCHRNARLAVLAIGGGSAAFGDMYDLVVPLDELPREGLADLRFRYPTAELCPALKPWLIRHLFDRFAGTAIVYLDADIELFSPLAEAEAALAHGANLVLTPHLLRPAADRGRDRPPLRSGAFNAGFLAFAASAEARGFVGWWCERVRNGDGRDPALVDRNWLETAPAICDRVAVLRHPGYNVAYWNAHERPLSCLAGSWTAAGWPLRFVHYSRWEPREQTAEDYLARYFPRDFSAEYQSVAALFADYRRRLQEEAAAEPETLRAADELHSPAGEPIPDLVRRAYARHAPAAAGGEAEVFGHAVAVLNAPSGERAAVPELPMTVLYDEIWRRHGDLRHRFEVERADGRLAYLRWLVEAGAAELGLPAAFVKPARTALDRARLRELEEGAQPPPPAIPGRGPAAPPAAGDALATLLAARDAERDQLRRQAEDVRLLVGSNKALRRELEGLRVRHWRDAETIGSLEAELAETRRAREAALRRGRDLDGEIAMLRGRPTHRLARWLGIARPRRATACGRRDRLPGDGPFLRRGFVLGEAALIVGTRVRRTLTAPSGTLIYGPYLTLPAGRYAVAVEAQLYRRLPVLARFRLDVVCDGARRVLAMRDFGLSALRPRRRCELLFSVAEEAPDCEVRIWARRGTPLEIAAIELAELSDEPGPAA